MFSFQEFTAFVQSLTPAIGATVRRHIGRVRTEYKADDSPVTCADREIEQHIVGAIEKHFPGGTIVGEESGTHAATERTADGAGSVEWIVDPIDGTKSFIHGVPLFATLIGVMTGGEAVYGAIYNPLLDELIVGDNRVALRNGVPTRMRECLSLGEATLLTTDILHVARHRNLRTFLTLAERCRVMRTWGDAYGYSLLATGRADIMVDPIMSRWDIAAVIPVIRGAGGAITDYYGGDPAAGNSIVACPEALYDTVMATLNPPDGA